MVAAVRHSHPTERTIMSDQKDNQPALEKIAEALLEIGETLETILSVMQEREAGFKARAARPSGPRSFGDRKPYGARPSYKRDDSYGDRDNAGGDDGFEDRKPRAPRKSFGDKDNDGPKKFGGGKRAFSADKKPGFKGRGGAGGDKPSGPRKTYKGGY